MKIVLDCERMKHPFTGIYEYCGQLGLALKRVTEPNTLIYYLPDQCKDYFGPDSNVFIQKSYHKFFKPNLHSEIIHITYQRSKYLGGNNNSKRVITIHDLNFLYESKSPATILKYIKLVQSNIDRCDSIVAISEFVRQDIMTHLNTGNKPVEVIYNGCNVAQYPDFDSPIYRPQKEFIFSIGAIVTKKNFHVLPALLRNNDLELVIAGKGDEEYALKIMDSARDMGVADRVKLLGPIAAEDKYWYLSRCKAFGFPSLAEGFGIPAIEAMSFGKPTFLSRLTSLPEVGGDLAYYFDNFDPESMSLIFNNSLKDYYNNQRSESIKEHASQFNWDSTARAYLRVYEKLNEATKFTV